MKGCLRLKTKNWSSRRTWTTCHHGTPGVCSIKRIAIAQRRSYGFRLPRWKLLGFSLPRIDKRLPFLGLRLAANLSISREREPRRAGYSAVLPLYGVSCSTGAPWTRRALYMRCIRVAIVFPRGFSGERPFRLARVSRLASLIIRLQTTEWKISVSTLLSSMSKPQYLSE